MKKSILLVLIIAMALSLCFSSSVFADDPLKVGLVFDVGGKGDKSFNDSASRGLAWAAEDFNIKRIELEPGVDADREVNLRMLASMGYDIVIGVGFLFDDAIKTVADEFPETIFASVDGFIPDKPNVVSLTFKEQDGGFLVGMIAGLKAKEDGKDTVGFVGGMAIALIKRFEAGYIAGVNYVYPECTVISAYAGDTGQAFANPVKGKELALAQYDNGAWVIFHASGLTGAGVFEAAKERKRFVIGVDSNQNYMGYIEETGESFGLTSMLKQVDVSIYLVVKSVIEGTFKSGIEAFGLDRSVTIGENTYYGVSYAMDEYNKDLVSMDIVSQVEAAKDKIISGEIVVPSEVTK
ncbi:MAG: BMP family ABC transporter substrate-binding protein [Candidatus Caldatribacteriota bacterium]|nr:BMP family ABC transporter substrate-binding protein [Candidatus Caldatribacteriota bacterium]